MPRPPKCKRICFSTDYKYYKPAGIPGNNLEEAIIESAELEALRLADYEGLYHSDAALRMNISRQTFGNLLMQARKKIADSIINGKMLKIETTENPEKENIETQKNIKSIYKKMENQ